MTYAAVDDMIQAFGAREVTQVAGTGDGPARVIDRDRVAAALTEAADHIDGVVGRRYRTPVIPAPRLLRTLALDMARYRLRNKSEGTSGNAADLVRDRYKDAVKTLEGIRDGKIVLEGAEATQGQGSVGVMAAHAPAIFADGVNGFRRRDYLHPLNRTGGRLYDD